RRIPFLQQGEEADRLLHRGRDRATGPPHGPCRRGDLGRKGHRSGKVRGDAHRGHPRRGKPGRARFDHGEGAAGLNSAATQSATRATPEALLALLARLGIAAQTFTHPAIFTVEEGRHLHAAMPGGHCKSLFMRTRDSRFVLAVVDADRRVPMGPFGRTLGTGRLSFATAEELRDRLGLTPGSVTPFGLVNDAGRDIRLVLDAAMMRDHTLLHYHPLIN